MPSGPLEQLGPVHNSTNSFITEHIESPSPTVSDNSVGPADGLADGPSSNESNDLPQHTENLGRGHRVKQPSVRFRDYVAMVPDLSPPTCSPSHHGSSGTFHPLAHYIDNTKFSTGHRALLANISAGIEPSSFKEAMQHEGWRQAMTTEIQALENNGTWEMCSLPPGKKALGCKWVYKIKFHAAGTVERLKARLVILGNHQVEGIDYTETFAPVAKMTTVRTLLAVAAAKKYDLHQMDVHNAFLHGDLDEEVYMKLPPGFTVRQPGTVCKLRKSLYGLRQASRCWFAKLTASLIRYGFIQSYSDYSLFTYHEGSNFLAVLVYVDDLIICGNNSSVISSFKTYLSHCFHMKDLGILKYFLGVEVARSTEGIFLCQRKYTLDILKETGLLGSRPSPTPIEQNHNLARATGDCLDDPERYRRLVGRLIYLSFTRPDLVYAVHILSQFMNQPRLAHWEAALRVVRYLKGTPGQGILLASTSSLAISGWCDSDWASCPLTRRSLTSWVVFLGSSPISWKTKKQHTVSRFSAEAEYRSMAVLTSELKWLQGLLSNLGVSLSSSMRMFSDSQ